MRLPTRVESRLIAKRQTLQRLAGMLRCPELTPRGKLSLFHATLRYHARRLNSDTVVGCGVASLRFGLESFATDWEVFTEVFIARVYAGVACQRSRVLDLGAHKGYFAVFALNHGAREVISFEPEPTNFRRLAAAAQSETRWCVRQEAIAGMRGMRKLALKDAWSHTLTGSPSVDSVMVPAVTLADVLGDSGHERKVVKIDIEGAECEALAATPQHVLATIDEIVIEVHPGAPCGANEIALALKHAGLSQVGRERENCLLHFASGSSPPRGPWPRQTSAELDQAATEYSDHECGLRQGRHMHR